MELPKVNIAVAASAVVAIVSTVGGGIWYASSQASVIESLTQQVETLTIENNATDRTNLIRDVEHNTEQIEEIIDYIIDNEQNGIIIHKPKAEIFFKKIQNIFSDDDQYEKI